MYKLVIFDLDGTLLNTLRDLVEAGNYTLKRMGFSTHNIDSYRYFIGNGIPKLIERMLPSNSNDETKAEALRIFREYYEVHKEDYTMPYKGVAEMLAKIKKNGVKTAVVTNKAHEFAEKMVKKYFGDLIDVIYGNVDGCPQKPNPYWVIKVIDDIKVKKEDVLYVGDSGVDMKTALNAGVASCGVLWGFRGEEELRDNGAKFICNDCDELFEFIL